MKFPELNTRYHDSVLHAILAHHGRREAGSPVAPKSRIAWLVHLSDQISARMADADTLDIIGHKKGE
jgi:23S rRNA maturation-related 3'-5' exoribonuclease YhaM